MNLKKEQAETFERLLIAFLLITSLFGYLEWGLEHGEFIFQMETQIFSIVLKDPREVLHPFIVLPFVGQLLLFFSLFRKDIRGWQGVTGTLMISFLFLFILFIGMISLNIKILLSTLPFLTLASVYLVRVFKARRSKRH